NGGFKSPIEKIPKQIRFRGDDKRQPRVMEGESLQFRNPQVRESDNRKWLGSRIEISIYLIRERDEERDLGMIASERLCENAREWQIVLRDYGSYCELCHPYSVGWNSGRTPDSVLSQSKKLLGPPVRK